MLIAPLTPRRLGRAIAGVLLLCPATALALDEAMISSAESAPELAIFAEIPDVAGASRYDQKSSEAPSSITVITAEEIARFGYRTIGEIVSAARGVFITNDRNYTSVVVRGFGRPGDYNSRLLLLVDGHRTNDEIYGSANVGGEAPVDIAAIDRVEIIRGASSALYGTDALFAVINIVTRSATSDPGLQIDVESGNAGERRAGATWGKRFGSGAEVFIQAASRRTRGERQFYPEFQSDTPTRGLTGLRDGEDLATLFAKVNVANWHFEVAHTSRDKDIPTASFETVFNDPRAKTIDRRFFAFARYERSLNDGAQISTTLANDRVDYRGWYPYEQYLTNDGSQSVSWNYDLQYLRPAGSKHRWVAGMELRHVPKQRQYAYNDDPKPATLDIDTNALAWALFVQDESRLTNHLTLNLGGRLDHHDRFGFSVSPRFALILAPDSKHTLKLLTGRSFRAPNDYETSYADGISQKANDNLRPEHLAMYELVYERLLSDRLHASATVYRYRLTSLVEQVTDPRDDFSVFINRGAIRSTGAEVDIEGTFLGNFEGRVSGAWQRPVDASSGARLTNAPELVAKALLWTPIGSQGWAAGLDVQHVSSRLALDGSTVDSYTKLGTSLRFKPPASGLVLALTVTNLLDTDYSDPGGEEHRQSAIPQDGRLWRIRVSYEF
jgi:iron complex outermembrane receptor protein